MAFAPASSPPSLGCSSSPSMSGSLSPSSSSSSFASLEERIAHLHWRKMCNERQIQGTLRLTKQLQERDEFLRVAKNDKQARVDWLHRVIDDEMHKPLPVTQHFVNELAREDAALDRSRQDATTRHMTHLRQIQHKLDEREVASMRRLEFERKKRELLLRP
ncbi:hypothetical protein PINS_up010574 [Pythium insidiosum]|nr:hypothetical protein PINS_up010574 [Pythium insidiosum]